MKKVNFLCMIVLGVFFSACNTDDDPWGDWEKSNTFPGGERVLAVSFKYKDSGGKDWVYVGLGKDQDLKDRDKYLKNFYRFDGEDWIAVAAPFPDLGREGCVAFVIGDIAYVGAGWRTAQASVEKTDIYYSDFYMFDLKNNRWMEDGNEWLKTDIVRDSHPKITDDDSIAAHFWSGVGFELKGMGYAGTGRINGRESKVMFTYDPGTGAAGTGNWTSTQMPGDPRVGAVVFKIDETAVIALGSNGSRNNVDVVAFDGTTWTPKAPLVDLAGDWNNHYNEIPRSFAIAFTSDLDYSNSGYIAGGSPNTVWRYTLEEDRWHEVEKFSRAMSTRSGAVGFSIKGIGYITTGGSSYQMANNNETWAFHPGVDEWDGNDYGFDQ